MILAILMIVGAGLFRLTAHEYQWWNVAPVGAMALLGGMYLGKRYALWVPLATLAVTDLLLNKWMGHSLIYVPRFVDYAAFMLIGALGIWTRKHGTGAKFGAGLATPFVFFLISNFGVWLFGLNLWNQPYPKTLAGLAACYEAGLPFLRGTMIGDWAFMAVFAAAVVLVRHTDHARFNWLVAGARA
jgi:hypothetical protein